jgi:hypothetical protein
VIQKYAIKELPIEALRITNEVQIDVEVGVLN